VIGRRYYERDVQHVHVFMLGVRLAPNENSCNA
jgi:hypothetical protein